eukprot:1151576-Pelagomonas_calceolata.AAC.1
MSMGDKQDAVQLCKRQDVAGNSAKNAEARCGRKQCVEVLRQGVAGNSALKCWMQHPIDTLTNQQVLKALGFVCLCPNPSGLSFPHTRGVPARMQCSARRNHTYNKQEDLLLVSQP